MVAQPEHTCGGEVVPVDNVSLRRDQSDSGSPSAAYEVKRGCRVGIFHPSLEEEEDKGPLRSAGVKIYRPESMNADLLHLGAVQWPCSIFSRAYLR